YFSRCIKMAFIMASEYFMVLSSIFPSTFCPSLSMRAFAVRLLTVLYRNVRRADSTKKTAIHMTSAARGAPPPITISDSTSEILWPNNMNAPTAPRHISTYSTSCLTGILSFIKFLSSYKKREFPPRLSPDITHIDFFALSAAFGGDFRPHIGIAVISFVPYICQRLFEPRVGYPLPEQRPYIETVGCKQAAVKLAVG